MIRRSTKDADQNADVVAYALDKGLESRDNLQINALSSSQDPLVVEKGASTHERTVHKQGHLPRPLARFGVLAADNPAHQRGGTTDWRETSTQAQSSPTAGRIQKSDLL